MKRLFAPLLLLVLPAVASAQAIGINAPTAVSPRSHTLKAPAVNFGFRIGETVAQARRAVPMRVKLDTLAMQPSPLLTLDDTLRGIKLWITPNDGIGIIEVSKRSAGNLMGIRVGDARLMALRALGPAAEERTIGGIWLLEGERLATVQWDPGSGQIMKITVAHER